MRAEPRPEAYRLPARELVATLRVRLAACVHDERELRLGTFSRAESERLGALFPRNTTRAAVLVPLVDRGEELTVLLTLRAQDLKHHAGQIAFPGGRIEPGDADAAAGALRETEEEIGLRREFVEVLGVLPDHVLISGYRVTPVIGLVRPGFELRLDPTEVAGTFEAPLRSLLDPATHSRRLRSIGGHEIETVDLPWGTFNIWGATAGMLLTLGEILSGNPRHGG